jgi:hypothetical protein
VRSLPGDFLGVNGEAVTAPSWVWRDRRFLRALGALGPQALRVFGGTPANFWDWRAGTFVSGAAVPSALAAERGRVRITLGDWARVARAASAGPVYDLNLVTSTLGEQLAMLHAARGLGLPVTRVELGNELYLPRYAARFPTGADYGREASRWLAAIKSAFPGVRVAAVGYLRPDIPGVGEDSRERDWNEGLLRTLRGEDALTFHAYLSSGLGPGQRPLDQRAAAAMLAVPRMRASRLRAQLAALPSGVSGWVTEFNLFDRRAAAQASWAQGLDVAAFALALLSDPRVDQADLHALVSSAPFGAIFPDTAGLDFGAPRASGARAGGFQAPVAHSPQTTAFGRSAGGAALALVLDGLRGASTGQPLSFASTSIPAPAAPGTLLGEQFQHGAHTAAVLVNLGPQPAAIALPATLAGASWRQLAAAPAALVSGPASLHRDRGRVLGRRMILAPYAVAELESRCSDTRPWRATAGRCSNAPRAGRDGPGRGGRGRGL